jgi:transposase
MAIGAPKDLIECRRFFDQPKHPRQRQYEALRAYFVEQRPSAEVARAFGYSVGAFRVLCHHFRREPEPQFFRSPTRGPRTQPKKSAARELIVQLRKNNYSVYEISAALQERKLTLSPTAVREVLREEGFAPLPRRLDDERPQPPRPSVEAVADVRALSLAPRRFLTQCGGLFLFAADLQRLNLRALAAAAHLPGSKMIPAEHALRACLALKLFAIERKRHVMALAADQGLALFCGLNAMPKKSYLSEYSSRLEHRRTLDLLGAWHTQLAGAALFEASSFNLDFHSVPYYGEHPLVEKHYVSARSRSQKSVLVFLAQDAAGRSFCYSNADLRKGEEADEIFRFVAFWEKLHHQRPRHLVFDSRLTTYANLAKLDALGISFITLRRRSPALLREVANLPRSAWRSVALDVPARKYKTPRIYEQKVQLAGQTFRQIYAVDLGHDEPTILLANDQRSPAAKIITRYAQRMLIENALSDAVRFFHIDALSSAVELKVDFDMALMVIASGLYRLLAQRMRGYADAQARQIFRDLVNMPATVDVAEREITVSFHRRAHLPILMASGLFDQPIPLSWCNNVPLRLTTYMAPTAAR